MSRSLAHQLPRQAVLENAVSSAQSQGLCPGVCLCQGSSGQQGQFSDPWGWSKTPPEWSKNPADDVAAVLGAELQPGLCQELSWLWCPGPEELG